MTNRQPAVAKLALEDGAVFTGTALGSRGTRTGEVVFNTAMTGYQEILTDPSYYGQIVTMTFPLLGNYGANEEDFESARPHLSGLVLKELPRRPSNHRATLSLQDFLEKHDILAIAGVDTRAVTRRIRAQGALRGVLSAEVLDDLELVRLARAAEPMTGANLVRKVAPQDTGSWAEALPPETGLPSVQAGGQTGFQPVNCHIVAIDCGIKWNILRHLATESCRVTYVPASATAAQIRTLEPDGLLIGNGPGDPAAVTDTIETIRQLLGTMPIFGICLGHQLLALALGARTYKLRFGHHGANVPVHNRPADRIEITSQNHGFAVDEEALRRVGGVPTHINLNDGSLEGFVHVGQNVAALQYHPEASPGPHDAGYVFRSFVQSVAQGQALDETVFGRSPAARAAKMATPPMR